MIRGIIDSFLFAAGLIACEFVCAAAGPVWARWDRGDFALVRAEFGGSNKVVQGAPYSAQAVTQFTQTLPNGDHIQRTTNASMARDSQGRTRTERSFGAIGALSAERGGARDGNDLRSGGQQELCAGCRRATPPGRCRFRRRTRPARCAAHARPERAHASAKTEDLGTQVIQGVSAQGKRVTRAIPAGKEGNEKEIDIVTETWYSPDLQVVVMSKTSDPRFGDSMYQLNAITRTEPDPALFAVPSDYTVKEGRPMMRRGPEAAQ